MHTSLLEDGKSLLLKILPLLKDETETDLFLSALLTPTERETFFERMMIIRGLLDGKTHRQISEETGASLATISRGSREIKFGSGIFQTLFQRLS